MYVIENYYYYLEKQKFPILFNLIVTNLIVTGIKHFCSMLFDFIYTVYI